MLIREINGNFDLGHGASPRSPGRHVSEVIKELALSRGIWKKDDQEELDFTLAKYRAARGDDVIKLYPAAMYRIAAGLAWESWYGPQQDINFHSIGELSKDRIIGTPDGMKIQPVTGRLVVPEIKYTWKSSQSDRKSPMERLKEEYPWTCQTCSYCRLATVGQVKLWHQGNVTLASDNLVMNAELHVFWSNGNYKGSGPELRVYEIEFTPEEVMGNWNVILSKSRQMDADQINEAAIHD